jgi:hypothetical protein
MRKFEGALMSCAVMATSALFAGTAADAYSSKVKDACAGDYQNFCAQYVPDSTELRRCFESNRKGLSRICISALVNAGEVPARYLKRR